MIASYTIDSSLQSVETINQTFLLFCQTHGIAEDITFQLELCLIEAVNNSIIHAYKNKPGQDVNVEYQLSRPLFMSKTLTLKVSDHGQTMNTPIPNTLAEPDKNSGRGWYIMQQWCDSVEYKTEDNTNSVILKKQLYI